MRENEQSAKVEGEAEKEPRRLQRRPVEMKRWIVEETLRPGASVAKVARRHGVNANQVFAWRKLYRQGRLAPSPRPQGTLPAHGLIRIGVIDQEGGLRSEALPELIAAQAGTAAEFSAPSLPPPPPLLKGPAAPGHDDGAMSGIIEFELPNRVTVRVDSNIGDIALRRVLAAARELP